MLSYQYTVHFYYRLREIEMSEYDAGTYESFSGSVRRQVQSLRVILDSLQVSNIYLGESVFSSIGIVRALRTMALIQVPL